MASTLRRKIHDPGLREVLRQEGSLKISFKPLTADAAWYKASTAPTAGANKTTTVTSFTAAFCPGWPTAIVTTCTDDADDNWTAMSAVVTGYDQFGDYISETCAGVHGTGTWTATSTQAFETLVSVAITITGTATSSDRYTIGFAKTYGIGRRLGAATDVITKLFYGSADAGTVSATYSTYVVAGTPNSAKELVLYVRPSFYTGRN